MNIQNKFEPCFDKVLVKGTKDKISAGGLAIPETAQVYSNMVEVVSTPDGRMPDGSTRIVKWAIGDKLMIFTERTIPISIEGEEYLVISETDIIGIFRD